MSFSCQLGSFKSAAKAAFHLCFDRSLDTWTAIAKKPLELPCRELIHNNEAGTGILTRCPSPTLRASA